MLKCLDFTSVLIFKLLMASKRNKVIKQAFMMRFDEIFQTYPRSFVFNWPFYYDIFGNSKATSYLKNSGNFDSQGLTLITDWIKECIKSSCKFLYFIIGFCFDQIFLKIFVLIWLSCKLVGKYNWIWRSFNLFSNCFLFKKYTRNTF